MRALCPTGQSEWISVPVHSMTKPGQDFVCSGHPQVVVTFGWAYASDQFGWNLTPTTVTLQYQGDVTPLATDSQTFRVFPSVACQWPVSGPWKKEPPIWSHSGRGLATPARTPRRNAFTGPRRRSNLSPLCRCQVACGLCMTRSCHALRCHERETEVVGSSFSMPSPPPNEAAMPQGLSRVLSTPPGLRGPGSLHGIGCP